MEVSQEQLEYLDNLLAQNFQVQQAHGMVEQMQHRVHRMIANQALKLTFSTGMPKLKKGPHDSAQGAMSERQSQRSIDLKQLQKARALRQKRAAKRLQQQLREIAETKQRNKAQEQEQQKKQRGEKRQQAQQGLRKIKQREQKRKVEQATANRKIKDLISKQTRHEKIVDKYLQNIVLPELHNRRKKLDDLKERNKNYSIQDVLLHQRKYQEFRRQHQEARSLERKTENLYKPPASSIWQKMVLEEERRIREESQDKKREMEDFREKQKEFVRKLDARRKVKGNQNSVDQTKSQQSSQRKKAPSMLQIRQQGQRYLQIAKQLGDKERIYINDEVQPKKHPNYLRNMDHTTLTEMRLKQLDQTARKNDRSQDEKISYFKKEANRLDQRVQNKVELMKQSNNVAIQQQAEYLLLQSVRAKKHILELVRDKESEQ